MSVCASVALTLVFVETVARFCWEEGLPDGLVLSPWWVSMVLGRSSIGGRTVAGGVSCLGPYGAHVAHGCSLLLDRSWLLEAIDAGQANSQSLGNAYVSLLFLVAVSPLYLNICFCFWSVECYMDWGHSDTTETSWGYDPAVFCVDTVWWWQMAPLGCGDVWVIGLQVRMHTSSGSIPKMGHTVTAWVSWDGEDSACVPFQEQFSCLYSRKVPIPSSGSVRTVELFCS